MREWIQSHQELLTPFAALVIGALCVFWLLPRGGKSPRFGAWVGVLAALAISGFALFRPHLMDLVVSTDDRDAQIAAGLFWLFSGTAIASGVAMIASRNPVYAALWFALVTLSVCGLFLLESAPFLAVATVIVYAGAIIVTFVFVIMLARQSGEARYDQKAQQPWLATVASAMLLGGILMSLISWNADSSRTFSRGGVDLPVEQRANVLSRPYESSSTAGIRGLGRSLFTDYLFAVELAGSLLLIATVGAVAIVPRRSQGGL